jgi:hypothetical protein
LPVIGHPEIVWPGTASKKAPAGAAQPLVPVDAPPDALGNAS